jgi:hypothetical protein
MLGKGVAGRRNDRQRQGKARRRGAKARLGQARLRCAKAVLCPALMRKGWAVPCTALRRKGAAKYCHEQQWHGNVRHGIAVAAARRRTASPRKEKGRHRFNPVTAHVNNTYKQTNQQQEAT